MISYEINYHTLNDYEEEVLEAIYDLLVLPVSNANQQLRQFTLTSSLEEEPFILKNKYDFDLIRLRSVGPFQEFEFSADLKVDSTAYLPDDIFHAHHLEEDWFTHEFKIEHHLFLYHTPYTRVSPKNSKLILPYSRGQNLFEFAQELNHYVHQLLDYETESTDVHTTADEVLELRRGVCQDYVHMFLSIARSNNFPSRYVSGYINQGKKLLGSARMHAWAEIFIPQKGWVGFDPTNDLVVDINYVKVAHGVDYRDCSPIRGVLKTKGTNTTEHSVRVVEQ